jgi:hypothetical protein
LREVGAASLGLFVELDPPIEANRIAPATTMNPITITAIQKFRIRLL